MYQPFFKVVNSNNSLINVNSVNHMMVQMHGKGRHIFAL